MTKPILGNFDLRVFHQNYIRPNIVHDILLEKAAVTHIDTHMYSYILY